MRKSTHGSPQGVPIDITIKIDQLKPSSNRDLGKIRLTICQVLTK